MPKQDKKRSFTIQGSDITFQGGNYKGDSPSIAARKAAKRLFSLIKDSKSPYHTYSHYTTIKFILREKTQGSNKKTYFYEANIHELKGNEIKYVKVYSPQSESANASGYIEYPVTKEIKVATCAEPTFKH